MSDYLGQGQVSANEGRWTLQLGSTSRELTTVDVTDGPQGETLAEIVRRRGKAIGFQRTNESSVSGGGGTFTLQLDKWEFDAIFGVIQMSGKSLYSFPFGLTLYLPVKALDSETGEETLDYGAERMINFLDCRVLGDPQPANSADGTMTVSIPCGYLRQSEVVKDYS
jgi:hypothetical protein